MYSKIGEKSVVDCLEQLLKMRHLCPTAPDTLRSFPFASEDPFIIRECPHVFFAGNQEKFEDKLVSIDKNRAVRLVSVPAFRETKSFVLVDMENL